MHPPDDKHPGFPSNTGQEPSGAVPLIGRERELQAVLAALEQPGQLLTIVGPTGIGKSRLALEAACSEHARTPGVFLCDVSEAADAPALCDAVAGTLGIGDGASEGDAVGSIARAIASRGPMLVVLDNFEASRGQGIVALERWLSAAPELRLMVTSRERLRIDGEQVHELGPLSLPDGTFEADASTRLLVQCVRALRHDWQCSPAEAPFLAGIARVLEGIPLAIQLAAPRLAIMSPRALLHRLSSSLQALGSKPKGRHSTLDAALEASWLALDQHEQRAMARIASFRGGFCLEAAESVLQGVPATDRGALDLLQALRDKSMLRTAPLSAPHELRLDLYRPVREWVERRADARELAAGRARHAEWFAAQAERWLRDPDASSRIGVERDNLLAVIHRVADHPPVTARSAEPALRSLLALSSTCESHGPAQAWISILDATLEATRDSGADPSLYARALCLRGAVFRDKGEWQRASRDLLQALSTARTLCVAPLEAEALLELSRLLSSRGEAKEAAAHVEKAIGFWRSCGMFSQEARAMSELAHHQWLQGLHDQARPLLERALAVHASHDALRAIDQRRLGLLLLDVGEHERARELLEQSAAISERSDDPIGASCASGWLALVDHDTGALESCVSAYERAILALHDHGELRSAGAFTALLGVVRREQGEPAQAYVLLRQGLAMMGASGDPLMRAVSLLHLAALDRGAGRTDDADASSKAAHAIATSLGSPYLIAWAQQHDPATSGIVRNVHVRIAARLQNMAAASAPPPADHAWVIAPAAEWFRPPHGERVSLSRRRPLARLLSRLSTQRREAPGCALHWQEVLQAAWPNEKVLATAGAHRVRVAVSTLRKLGLKELLVTVEEGYLLRADSEVVQL